MEISVLGEKLIAFEFESQNFVEKKNDNDFT